MPIENFKARKGIATSGPNGNAFSLLVPTGTIIMYSGTTAPDGWLLCDGTTHNKVDYPDLSAMLQNAIPSSYPYGSTSTTFNVPNLNGRAPLAESYQGSPRAGASALTVGGSGGSNAVTLDSNHLPAHQHGTGGHTHSSADFSAAGGHYHHIPAFNTGWIDTDHAHYAGGHTHQWYFSAIRGTGTARLTKRGSGTQQNAGIGGGNRTTGGEILGGHTHNNSGIGTNNQSANHAHSFTTNANAATNTGGTFTPTAVTVAAPKINVAFIIKT